MSKFDGLISIKDQIIVESIISNLDLDIKNTVNIAETLENTIYLQPAFFKRFTQAEKIKGFTMVTTILDTLLDEDINPLARYYILRSFDVFNNNIFDVVGGRPYVQ